MESHVDFRVCVHLIHRQRRADYKNEVIQVQLILIVLKCVSKYSNHVGVYVLLYSSMITSQSQQSSSRLYQQ